MRKKKEKDAPRRAAKQRIKLHADTVSAFLEHRADKTFSFRQLVDRMGLRGKQDKQRLATTLDELEAAGRIQISADGQIQTNAETQYVEGVIEHVNPRFGYLVSDTLDEDIRLSTDDLNDAFDGDRVRVRVRARKRKGEWELSGVVEEILARARTEYVGTIQHNGHFSFVVPDARRLYEDVYVKGEHTMQANDGDKVIVKITKWPDGRRGVAGKVIKVLGPAGHNDAEMHAIMAEYGLPLDFPLEVQREADAIDTRLPAAEIKRRRDLRDVLTFTIDPVDAKDFDDALSLRRLDNGNWEVGVHIADVTHYVRPGTALEAEALRRATSVYLVDRVVPMLPEKLSNGLCSLRPHEDKFTFSAIFELNEHATVKHQWFGRTVIHSDRRFAYEEAQQRLDGEAEEYREELLTLNRMAKKLRAKRFKAGAIGFETTEVRFKLDANGKPLGVVPKVRQDAHKLIEEFMLLANRLVAEQVFKKKARPRLTMVYRVHEAPDPDRLATFATFAQKFNYQVSLEGKAMSTSLNRLITDVAGKPEQDILQGLAIRTMAKARYDTEPLGHFGLAFAHYTHFTSPIRRYPDMMVHRLLQRYLDGQSSADREEYQEQCAHASERERVATEAERASIKYKQVEYMSMQPERKVFDGIVSGLTEYGIFVEMVENKCEGMVRMSDLQDDYYELDAENFRVIGQRNKRIIGFGDSVRVRLKDANLEKRIIDLYLVR